MQALVIQHSLFRGEAVPLPAGEEVRATFTKSDRWMGMIYCTCCILQLLQTRNVQP